MEMNLVAGNNDATDDPLNKTGLAIFYRNGYKESRSGGLRHGQLSNSTPDCIYKFQEDSGIELWF